jgi:hypothetical protein
VYLLTIADNTIKIPKIIEPKAKVVIKPSVKMFPLLTKIDISKESRGDK